MRLKVLRTQIAIESGELSTQQVDAIVSPANNYLWMGGKVALALKSAAGESVEEEATGKGPAAIGDAIVTRAGELDAGSVIHAVVAGQDLKTDADAIRKAVSSSLDAAEERRAKSVAFPLIGLDPGTLDPPSCTRALIGAIVDHLMAGSPLTEVRIVTEDEEHRRAIVDAAGERFTA